MTDGVYLQPSPVNVPTKYQESIEKDSLIVSEKHILAIYTSSPGPRGDQGPQGEPYLWDTIIASASDEYSPLVVDPLYAATHFRAPFPITLEYVRCSVSVAPEGAAIIVDVHMNDVSIFSSLLQIDALSKTSVGSAAPAVLSTTAVPDDAEFKVWITQVGNTVAGSGLKVALTGKKVQV